MNEFWKSRTASERRLAILAAVLGVVFATYLVVIPAVRYVRELDRRIAQEEDELVTDTELAARSESVGREYAKIASEHSSKWSKEEIHDRLGQEIDRLAEEPPRGGVGALIQIPAIPYGKLTEGGKDFRQYQLTFKSAPASIGAISEYLKRLDESPQALRIDGLELTRAPESGVVTATIDVTRTVVNGVTNVAPRPAAVGENLIRNGSFELPSRGAPNPVDNWDTVGCLARPKKAFATDGSMSLVAVFGEHGGSISQEQTLEGGAGYELQADMKCNGPVRIGVASSDKGSLFPGAVTVVGDNVMRRYVVRFTVPGAADSQVAIRAPFVELEKGKKEPSSLYMDNVVLKKVTN